MPDTDEGALEVFKSWVQRQSFFEIYRDICIEIDLKRSSHGHFHTYRKSNYKYSIQSAQQSANHLFVTRKQQHFNNNVGTIIAPT